MAVDTAPAVAPGPDDKPADAPGTAAPGGLLSSLLTPVEPARPLTALTVPAPADASGPGAVAPPVSSAAFHDTAPSPKEENSAKNGVGNSREKRKEGVIRAWLLAGAERWGKGAAIKLKQLEVDKAKAAALAKSAVNTPARTPAPPAAGGRGGGGGVGSGRDVKGPGGRGKAPAPAPRPASDPKLPAPAPAPKSTDPAPKPTVPKSPAEVKTPSPKPPEPKAPEPKAPAPKKTDAAPPAPPATPPPKAPGKPGPSEKMPPGPGASTATAPSGTDAPKAPKAAPEKPPKAPGSHHARGSTTGPSGTGAPSEPTPKRSGHGAAKDTPAPKRSDGHVDLTKKKTPPADTDTAGSTKAGTGKVSSGEDAPKGPGGPAAKGGTGSEKTPKKDKAPGPPAPAGPKTPRSDTSKAHAVLTRTARETGYRDGHRVGLVAAYTRAYGHGVRDGWTDALAAADDEKKLLDHARTLRKEEREDPPMPTAPPKPTSPPTAPAAEPIVVTGIDATHVHLGDGATRTSLARGEVRTLKGFERRLEEKRAQMQLVAETTKGLAGHAAEQKKEVTELREQAKGVKGGEKLLAILARLEDDAQTQVDIAQDLNARSARGADATGAVLVNAQVRYGDIYKAVVDSDETAPAELRFYRR